MEKKIKDAFDNMMMPDVCADRIERAMVKRRSSVHPGSKRIFVLAASLVLVFVMLCTIPMAVKAMEPFLEQITMHFEQWFGMEPAARYEYQDGNFVINEYRDEKGNAQSSASYQTGSIPNWLMEENGRLYFVGNKERIDITDAISPTEGFMYSYRDSKSIYHYIAVGGTYDPQKGIMNSVMGWEEIFLRGGNKLGGYGTFLGGTTENDGWYESAFEQSGLPRWYWATSEEMQNDD